MPDIMALMQEFLCDQELIAFALTLVYEGILQVFSAFRLSPDLERSRGSQTSMSSSSSVDYTSKE